MNSPVLSGYIRSLNIFLEFGLYLIGNAATCRQIPQSASMRDVDWATNTCTLSFQTIGIWPEGADGTDVNHCDRSNDQKLVATADDFGKVKLYSYPVSHTRVSI